TWWPKPDHYVIPAWDDVPATTSCTKPYALYGADHMAPSCDPIWRAMNLPAARAQYIQAIKDMLAGPLNVPKIQADIDRWANYLRPAVMATTSASVGGIMINSAIPPAAWANEVAAVKNNVAVLRDRIAGVVDGKPFRP